MLNGLNTKKDEYKREFLGKEGENFRLKNLNAYLELNAEELEEMMEEQGVNVAEVRENFERERTM